MDYSSRPYSILAGESQECRDKALQLARTADVCVFGACSQEYAVARAKSGTCGLSFECGERWLKGGGKCSVSGIYTMAEKLHTLL